MIVDIIRALCWSVKHNTHGEPYFDYDFGVFICTGCMSTLQIKEPKK